jgi:pimeloyl-ACP methyl ester carboxylesterase
MSLPAPEHPGAVAPERSRSVDVDGGRIHLQEWGDPEATPLVLLHGMWDHGRGFDMLAPLLAERFRVVAMDARGHGDSSWCDAYLWPVDVRDVCTVLLELGRPSHIVGHSRGGGLSMDAAALVPECVRQLVNIDGFGPPSDEGFPRPGQEAADRPSAPAERFREYLDRRRGAVRRASWRVYPDLEDLVERRLAQNPRLDRAWLRYFAYHGSREVEGGRVWKSDPFAGMSFGPFKPAWIAPGWRHVRAPVLAVIGSEPDTWGPIPEPMREDRLGHLARVEKAVVQGAGHFTHMERPRETADLVQGFLEP